MEEPQIRFDDGAAYEDFMGQWSRPAGEVFLRWLALPADLRWLDVGCGNGAFTALLQDRCVPRHVHGIDPSEGQLAYARTRLASPGIDFELGDAMALPCAAGTFDAAVMALVIFFAPDPARAVAEMVRVVAPGGSVSAYAWDILGHGFPYAALNEEMEALGVPALLPPSPDASRLEAMQALWAGAGLESVETTEITVERTFADFETYWRIVQTGPRITPKLASMAPGDRDRLRERLQHRLPADALGRITCSARANAVKGRVPAAAPPQR